MNIKKYVMVFCDAGIVLTKKKFPKNKYLNDYYIDEEYPWYNTMRFPTLEEEKDDFTLDDFLEFFKEEWMQNMTEKDKEDIKKEMEKYDKENKDFIIKIEKDGKYGWIEEYDREKIVEKLKKQWIKFWLEKWKEIQERLKKENEEWLLDKVKKMFK